MTGPPMRPGRSSRNMPVEISESASSARSTRAWWASGTGGSLYAHEDRLGLQRATVHDLRHTAASIMLASGLQLEDVRDALGHSSVSITSATYGHAMAERQREVAHRMEQTLG
jgi:integrase